VSDYTRPRLRTATAEGVGAQRLAWTEDLAVKVRHWLSNTAKP
jgi:hypothetical protein